MPMPKRKPNYNRTATMQELLTAVCEFYGDPVDDRKQEDPPPQEDAGAGSSRHHREKREKNAPGGR